MNLAEMGLEIIKKRYFCELIGEVRHLPECEINRTKKPRFCSCGLLHDLNYYFIYSNLAKVIYPDYQKDVYLQETQKEWVKEKRNKEIERKLEEVFGPFYENTEEIQEEYNRNRSLIAKVFQSAFPNAITRL